MSDDHNKKNEMSKGCGMCWERRGAYRVLMGKSQKKGAPGSHRHRQEDNIEMNVQEIRQEAETGGSRKGQTAGSCEHGTEPLSSTKCREFLD
jgi:hypothetical protein